MNSDYTYWQNALAGNFGLVHDGEPHCGFYEARNKKAGTRQACAIWRNADGLLTATQDGRPVDPNDVWTWVCRTPIKEEVFRRVERGEGWPDAIEELIGHNNPPQAEAETDEVEAAVKSATTAAGLGIASQLEADRLGNMRDRLAKLYQAKEKERKTEKEPHLEAGREVDRKFTPILDKLESAGRLVKAELTKWLRAEDARLAKEQAEKVKAEQLARAAAVEQNVAPPPVEAPQAEIEKPRAGTMGRVTGLREFKSAQIVDYGKALQALASNPEIQALVQTLADRAARAGVAIDGCEIKLEKRAA